MADDDYTLVIPPGEVGEDGIVLCEGCCRRVLENLLIEQIVKLQHVKACIIETQKSNF